MTQNAAPRLDPGDELAHYRVESAVGEGAMGTVYRAHDTSLDRTVGLKVLKPEVSSDERFVKRFVREARAAARVSHPNLTHIYFIGEQGGRHFFAMEFVEGEDLQTILEEGGALELDRALGVLVQAARGLRAAHRAGVVHRDIKPSNLLLQPDGEVRITDFGLAKSLDVDVEATQAGLVSGTPTYMSPEQCRGLVVDQRSDIYALGLTAFTLLTGRKAYEADSLGSLIDSQLNVPLPRLEQDGEALPDEVDEVVRRMCAKDRDERFEDMDAVIRALEGCRARPVVPAPLASRLMATVVDLLPVFGVSGILGLFVSLVAVSNEPFVGVAGTAFLCVLFALYQVGCEARWGRTLGKWLFGIRVTTERGTRPPLRRIVPRFLIRYPAVLLAVPDEILGVTAFSLTVLILQLVAIVGAIGAYSLTRGRTLSDILTRTRVTVDVSQDTSSITQ